VVNPAGPCHAYRALFQIGNGGFQFDRLIIASAKFGDPRGEFTTGASARLVRPAIIASRE